MNFHWEAFKHLAEYWTKSQWLMQYIHQYMTQKYVDTVSYTAYKSYW